VRLSASRAGRPLPPRSFLVLISVRGWVDPQGHNAAGRIRSIEKSSDFIGIWTRDLPAWIGMEGSGCTLIYVLYSVFARRNWRKPRETSVRIADVPAEIRTEHLPNTSLEHYGYTRRLPTAAAWVRSQVRHVGFVLDSVSLKQIFSRYLGFPFQLPFHKLLHIR
jgi:hypothetical protein